MIQLAIPGYKETEMQLEYLLLDFNGTLAIDGKLIEGVKERLNALSETLTIHVLTGNTFKTAEYELKNIKCNIVLLPSENQGDEKGKYIQKDGLYTMRVFSDPNFVKFAIENQGYGKVISELK